MATASSALARRDRPRGPGIVYASLTVVLLILIAAIALTARQPPPPSIAESAPQAVEQIKQAPTEQSSRFGSAGGGSGPGEPGAGAGGGGAAPSAAPVTVPPPPKPIDVARVRRCIGDPPRQIEDPQSP